MNLLYRGVDCAHNSSVAEVELDGCYRGQAFHWHPVLANQHFQVLADLIYRGTQPLHQMATSTRETVDAEQVQAFQPQSVQPLKDIEALHQQHILEKLQMRLQSAKARGDQRLIKLLEAEHKQMV